MSDDVLLRVDNVTCRTWAVKDMSFLDAIHTTSGVPIGPIPKARWRDFPLSHPAPQPERTAQPPVANEDQLRQAPHGLQPQPKPPATFSPASARCN